MNKVPVAMTICFSLSMQGFMMVHCENTGWNLLVIYKQRWDGVMYIYIINTAWFKVCNLRMMSNDGLKNNPLILCWTWNLLNPTEICKRMRLSKPWKKGIALHAVIHLGSPKERVIFSRKIQGEVHDLCSPCPRCQTSPNGGPQQPDTLTPCILLCFSFELFTQDLKHKSGLRFVGSYQTWWTSTYEFRAGFTVR